MTMGEIIWLRWRGEIAALGPVPEADVLAARLEIVDFALALVESGDIFSPRPSGQDRDEDDFATKWEKAKAAGTATTFADVIKTRFFAADGNEEEEEEEEEEEDSFVIFPLHGGASIRRIRQTDPLFRLSRITVA